MRSQLAVLKIILLLSVGLTGGCIDGGHDTASDGGSATPTPTPPIVSGSTGFLIDSAVSGVAYETPTHQGVTGVDGSFQYEEGETVRFMLGGTLLGEVTGQPQVTPFDLAGSAVITGTPNISKALNNERDAFHKVINISVLLQSLDHDSYPDNGIEITPEVAALFQGIRINLSQSSEAFRRDQLLRHVIGQANTKGLFNDTHGVANPAHALQHLYNTLGINGRVQGIRRQQVVGSIDATRDGVTVQEFDARGNVIREERDRDGDGTPEGIETSQIQYYPNGNQSVVVVNNYGSDGTLSSVWTWQYDPSGNVTGLEITGGSRDSGGGSRVYDANGNVTRDERDEDGDGIRDELTVWQYQYDPNGNMTQARSEGENNGSPVHPTISEYRYDIDGNLTWSEIVDTVDGNPHSIESWQYDADGYITRHEIDDDGDGTPNDIDSWNYDSNEKLVEHESLRVNYFSTGFDIYNLVQYDANGNVTYQRTEFHPEAPPILENAETWYEYQHDANGNVTRIESDENNDGTPDNIEIRQYQYAPDGAVMRIEYDEDSDGIPNLIESYDTNGNLTRKESYDEGLLEGVLTQQYVATGWGVFFPPSIPFSLF